MATTSGTAIYNLSAGKRFFVLFQFFGTHGLHANSAFVCAAFQIGCPIARSENSHNKKVGILSVGHSQQFWECEGAMGGGG
jgi:hypothetical protein